MLKDVPITAADIEAPDAPEETTDEGGKVSYKYSGFVYRPRRSNKVTASGQEVNTRDYTIIVPHGVEVWGGYSDAYTSADNNGFYTKVSEGNYTDNRDVLKNRTTLSGVYQADDQDVNVYNVVTFTNDTYNEEGKHGWWNGTISMMKTGISPAGCTAGEANGSPGNTAWWSACGSTTAPGICF